MNQTFLAEVQPNPFFFYLFIFATVASLVLVTVQAALILKSIKIVPPEKAILRTGFGGSSVSFDKTFVIPFLHQYETIDLTARKFSFERMETAPVIFQGHQKATVIFDVFIRINKEPNAILLAAQRIGVDTLNDAEKLRSYFAPVIQESIEQVTSDMDFEECLSNRDLAREKFLKTVGISHNGLAIDDIAIHHLSRME